MFCKKVLKKRQKRFIVHIHEKKSNERGSIMIYKEKQMEEQAVLQTASRMCAAARTAPKARGIDDIQTMVLTGEDKDRLADKMEEMGQRDFGEKAEDWYIRDARNVRAANAVVLIGAKRAYRGVQKCGFCGFKDCGECRIKNGRCAFQFMDLGIALSSAAAAAADERVDNRIMFSVGKAAMELLGNLEDMVWQGIPISVSGKNVFFDRKKK